MKTYFIYLPKNCACIIFNKLEVKLSYGSLYSPIVIRNEYLNEDSSRKTKP